MKIIEVYNFDPVGRTVTITEPGFFIEKVTRIINIDDAEIIYDSQDQTRRYKSFSGNVITLSYDTEHMLPTDKLRIEYEATVSSGGSGGGGSGDASAANQATQIAQGTTLITNTGNTATVLGTQSDTFADSTVAGSIASRLRSALSELEDIQDVLGDISDPVVTSTSNGTLSSRLRYVSEKLNNIDLDFDSLLNVTGTTADNAADFTVSGTIASRIRYNSQQLTSIKIGIEDLTSTVGFPSDPAVNSATVNTLMSRLRGIHVTLENTLLSLGTITDVAVTSTTNGTLQARQRGIHVSLDGLSGNVGTTSDVSATSDTGNFSLIAFIKRGLTNWTTFLTRLGSITDAVIDSTTSGSIFSRLRGTQESVELIQGNTQVLQDIVTDGTDATQTNPLVATSLFGYIKGIVGNTNSIFNFFGLRIDAPAATDTDNSGYAAKFKYFLTRLTTLITTLTDGTLRAIGRGGAKGITVAADVTSSNIDANTQAWDVAIKQDLTQGTSATGVTMPAGGAGLLGWLSGIYSRLSNTLVVRQELSVVTPSPNTTILLTANVATAGTTIPAGAKYMYLGFRGTQPLFFTEDGTLPAVSGATTSKFLPQNGFIIEDQVETVPRGASLRFISSAAGTVILQFRS